MMVKTVPLPKDR